MTGLAAAAAGRCRPSFAVNAAKCCAGAAAGCGRPITIDKTSCGFEREPMVRPFYPDARDHSYGA